MLNKVFGRTFGTNFFIKGLKRSDRTISMGTKVLTENLPDLVKVELIMPAPVCLFFSVKVNCHAGTEPRIC